MRKLPLRPILAVAIISLVTGWLVRRTTLADRITTFSSLTKDDALDMEFRSIGCFHHNVYELKFRRSGDLHVKVTQLVETWSYGKNDFITRERIDLGEMALTKADETGLDRLLEFYRSRPEFGSMTSDEMFVTQRHEGWFSAKERLQDYSGRKDEEGRTSIQSLIARLKRNRN
jgi:hypothetical protein